MHRKNNKIIIHKKKCIEKKIIHQKILYFIFYKNNYLRT